MSRSPGDPFEPGTKVWFRESPEAYVYARSNDITSGVVAESGVIDNDHRTRVVSGEKSAWVPTALLRSSPPRWATGKQRAKPTPKPHARKEAVDPAYGTELTFDTLEA